jgi:prolyl 4-hydroxylase
MEVDQLLSVASYWENSTESGEINEIGEGAQLVLPSRTSSSFWCLHDCKQKSIVKAINAKVEDLLNISSDSFEPIQLLRYYKDQRFVDHHDYSYHELSLLCGPRIMTFFMYLSDVEDGGETVFSQLNIVVKPKKGKAILWANTLDSTPSMKDFRMTHAALPVLQGTKYAANLWIHLNEWERPSLWACTGA